MRRGKPICFVIMPYGSKPVGEHEINFDLIWTRYIQPAGEAAGFETVRADKKYETGIITKEMIADIHRADIAVAEVTSHNPNVFYELGVRHALAGHGTILVKRKTGAAGGPIGVRPLRRGGLFSPRPTATKAPDIPFDLTNVSHLFYELSEAALPEAITSLKACIEARHASRESDSPVHTTLSGLRISTGGGPCLDRRDATFEILEDGAPTGRFIGYRSGDVAQLTVESGLAVDYWVNSENTLMQMARVYERAMSATIRSLGASSDRPTAPGYEDTVQDALTEALGNRPAADEGEVLVTTSGRLRETHGVKAILHAAVVSGAPRRGFEPIGLEHLGPCVQTVIARARELNRGTDQSRWGRSVLMPLFGTGQGGRAPAVMAGPLLEAAMGALTSPAPDLEGRDVNLVLFSAFSSADVDVMRRECMARVVGGRLRGPIAPFPPEAAATSA